MSDISARGSFERTLPLFTNRDRDLIQRLLHHAVEDLRYDHPDRKVARDLYHDIREGEAIRLLVGSELDDETFVITPAELDSDLGDMLERFVQNMRSESGEWVAIAAELDEWRGSIDSESEIRVAFQYLH